MYRMDVLGLTAEAEHEDRFGAKRVQLLCKHEHEAVLGAPREGRDWRECLKLVNHQHTRRGSTRLAQLYSECKLRRSHARAHGPVVEPVNWQPEHLGKTARDQCLPAACWAIEQGPTATARNCRSRRTKAPAAVNAALGTECNMDAPEQGRKDGLGAEHSRRGSVLPKRHHRALSRGAHRPSAVWGTLVGGTGCLQPAQPQHPQYQ